MSKKIILGIGGVHMGLGHEGLKRLAKEFGTDPLKIGRDEMIVFTNAKQDKLKIICSGGEVLGYLRLNQGKIGLSSLQRIPLSFGGRRAKYSDKFARAFIKSLGMNKPVIFRSKAASDLTARKATNKTAPKGAESMVSHGF